MAKRKNRIGSTLKPIIVAIFFVSLVLFYFNYLSDKSAEKKTVRQKDEIQKLSDYDMLNDYPKTPRDVVKLYCRYYKVFYGQSLKDEELKTLSSQISNLYADELLKYNTEQSMFKGLKTNIKEMQDEGITYKSYSLPEASQIKNYKQDGKEMAALEVEITVNMKKDKGLMYQQFVLVKENDKWKILAWGDSKMGDR